MEAAPTRSVRLPSSDILLRALASLFLAFLLWAWVTTQRDPPDTRRYADLTLQVPTLPEPLQISGELPRVTVEVNGPRSVVDDISRSGLRPYLDLSGIDGPGNYQAPILVDLPAAAHVESIDPGRVPLVVDKTTTQTFHLDELPVQIDDPTRRIGEVVPSVSEVTVTGPERLVTNVARVVLPIDIGDHTDDFNAQFVPVALDGSGQQIPEVTILPAGVETAVEVDQRGRSVPVLVQTAGNPAPGFEIVGSVANPSTVLLDGPDAALADILSVVTAPVDIEGATDTVSTRTALQELPTGVRVVNPLDGSVVAVVQIRPRGVTQQLNDLPLTITDVPAGFTATVDPPTIGVVVFAAEETMANLRGDDITTSVSAAGLTAGRNQVRPSVTVPPEVQWLRTDPQTVVVTLEPIRTTPPPSPNGIERAPVVSATPQRR
ncbi:MAG: CdaR family protein [Thermomicrobiales bacterium]